MGCVSQEAYLADLEFIAAGRPSGTMHWQATQDLCADRLAELGYEVQRDVYETGVNVIGTKVGLSLPDERVVVGAHYDHLPGCSGADDNATGVAGVLEVARVFRR